MIIMSTTDVVLLAASGFVVGALLGVPIGRKLGRWIFRRFIGPALYP